MGILALTKGVGAEMYTHDTTRALLRRRPQTASVLTVDRVVSFTARDHSELAKLASAARGLEASKSWPGRHLEWAPPQWYVRARDAAGNLVSVTGIIVREGFYNGRQLHIGGVGGVKTHPDARRQGYATKTLRRATEFFRSESDVAFAVLVCDRDLLGFYTRRGWCDFRGTLLIRTFQSSTAFTIASVMTQAIHASAPRDGTIDLCGPPW